MTLRSYSSSASESWYVDGMTISQEIVKKCSYFMADLKMMPGPRRCCLIGLRL